MERNMIKQRFECPECGEFKMTKKQKANTNACGDCEISEFKWNKPQRLVCWNKHCRRKFSGNMLNHKKYTLCPVCKRLAGEMIDVGGLTKHEHKRVGSAQDAYPGEVIVCL